MGSNPTPSALDPGNHAGVPSLPVVGSVVDARVLHPTRHRWPIYPAINVRVSRFESHSLRSVMSRDIGNPRTYCSGVSSCCCGRGVCVGCPEASGGSCSAFARLDAAVAHRQYPIGKVEDAAVVGDQHGADAAAMSLFPQQFDDLSGTGVVER